MWLLVVVCVIVSRWHSKIKERKREQEADRKQEKYERGQINKGYGQDSYGATTQGPNTSSADNQPLDTPE